MPPVSTDRRTAAWLNYRSYESIITADGRGSLVGGVVFASGIQSRREMVHLLIGHPNHSVSAERQPVVHLRQDGSEELADRKRCGKIGDSNRTAANARGPA